MQVVGFVAGFACHLTLAPHHGDGLQVRPVFGRPQQVFWHLHEPMLPAFDAPVVVGIGAFQVVAVRLLGKVGFAVFVKPRSDLPMRDGVVGFEVEHVVRFALDDRFGDGLLAAHGINRHDAAFDAEQL